MCKQLKGAEKTKYEIYHAIKDELPKVKDWKQFEHALNRWGISIDYKYKGQTDEVRGVSFKKGEHSFKGSEIDRKYSYAKLDAQLNDNIHAQGQQQQMVMPKETSNGLLENIVSGATDVVSGIGGLFDIQPSNNDPNESENLRQPKKKKKKRRGFGFGNS